MDSELTRRLPANAMVPAARSVAGGRNLPRLEWIEHRDRDALELLVEQLARRGEIGKHYRLRWDGRWWQAEVQRIKERRRRLRMPRWGWIWLTAGGCATAVATVFWLVVELLQAAWAAATAAASALGPLLLLGLVLLLLASLSGGTVTVLQKVTIRR